MFCSDIDLLRWEPHIVAEAAFATLTLLTAPASLAGTTLTLSAGSFDAARVRAGFVACLSGTVNGSFPILSIDSESTCTLSVMYDGLEATSAEPVSPGDAAELNVVVRSFFPQRKIISDLLSAMAGIEPDGSATILNAGAFRRPCALGTLHLIYSAMSTAAFDDRSDLIVRAELYERLYRKSLRGLTAEIDTDGDGVANTRRMLRMVQFARV